MALLGSYLFSWVLSCIRLSSNGISSHSLSFTVLHVISIPLRTTRICDEYLLINLYIF